MTFRILLFLILTGAIALGFDWLLQNNGEVSLVWLGYEVKTSMAFVIFALIFTFVLLIIIFQLLYTLLTFPSRVKRQMNKLALENNLKNLQIGYAALLSGDHDLARKASQKLISSGFDNRSIENMSQMLAAKIAQEDGNSKLAEGYYDKFLTNKKHKFFAIKGKLDNAFKKGDIDEAISLAEDAYRLKPNTKDGARSLLELYKKAARYDKAEDFLKSYRRKHYIFTDKYNNIDVDKELEDIWFAKAKDIYDNSDGFKITYDQALQYAKKCLDRKPDENKYLILVLKICKALKNEKYARQVTERAWKNNQSFDLGVAYLEAIAATNPKDASKKKLKAIEHLGNISFNADLIEKLRDKVYDVSIDY